MTMRALVLGAGLFGVIGALAGLVFWASPASVRMPDQATAEPAASAPRTPHEIPAGRREYHDEQYHFSLLYPEELTVSKIDEGEGATTITFQNEATVEGFQIFIVPYGFPQVTAERLKKDIPSGARNDVRDITIDGATGAAFYSAHEFLGETAEVWFIQGGYLYEVTTLKSLAPWLSEIMATWQFI